MTMTSFDFDGDKLNQFISFPWQVYSGDSSWVPPLKETMSYFLSRDNPVFGYGSIKHFMTLDNNRVTGRCSAIINPNLIVNGQKIGLFGYFECEEDETIAQNLMGEVLTYLKNQGCEKVLGPMNFSIWHEYRFMTKGFDKEIFFGEPYNKRYYPGFITACGFTPRARYYSWDLATPHLQGMQYASKKMGNPELVQKGFRQAPFDVENFPETLLALYHLLDEGFKENFAYSPLDFPEFKGIFGGLKEIIIPEVAPMIYSPENELIGFAYLYPDLAPLMRAVDGEGARLFDSDFLSKAPKTDRLIFHTMVIQKQFRRLGIVETFLGDILGIAFGKRFTRAVGALAKEGPTVYDKTGEPTREYTLFEQSL